MPKRLRVGNLYNSTVPGNARTTLLASAKSLARPFKGVAMGLRTTVSAWIPWDLLARARGNHPRPTGSLSLDAYFAGKCLIDRFEIIHTPENIQYPPLPDLGQELPEFFRVMGPEVFPAAGVATFNHCRFWGHYGGTLVAQTEQVIEEFSREVWQIEKNRIFHRAGLPQPVTLKGTTAILTSRGADTNFYHWTIDLLPRILLLKRALGTLEGLDHFLINHRGLRFQLETLEELGIPMGKVISPTAAHHFRLEHALAPTIKEPLGPVPSWMIESCRKMGPYATFNSPKRIFVSRRPESGRNVSNEAELMEMLERSGFERVYLEDHSVRNQRALFEGADQILAIHGAGLANLAWAKPGTQVVEIFTPKLLDLAFRRISAVGQLPYAAILAEGPPASSHLERSDFYRPIEVSVSLVEKAFNHLASAGR